MGLTLTDVEHALAQHWQHLINQRNQSHD
jgi:hypothetical protein